MFCLLGIISIQKYTKGRTFIWIQKVMQIDNYKYIFFVLIIIVSLIIACQQNSEKHEKNAPARVEHIEGSELSRVILTEKAIERLDLTTASVYERIITQSPPQMRKVVPYSAIIYDKHGNTWVYTSPEQRVYIRHQIIIDVIHGKEAFLLDGPPVGVTVVKVGAAELYGVEFGIGH